MTNGSSIDCSRLEKLLFCSCVNRNFLSHGIQQLQRIEQKTKVKKSQAATFEEIDSMGRKTFTGKVELTAQEVSYLKEQAKRGISAAAVISDLKKKLEASRQDVRIWKDRYESLLA